MWDKFKDLLGTINEFRELQFEMDLTTLVHNSLSSTKEFFGEIQFIWSLLQGCGNDKTDKECIFIIFPKLLGPFQVFASTFYSTMNALGDAYTFPFFKVFCDRMMWQHANLSQLDPLFDFNSQALVE